MESAALSYFMQVPDECLEQILHLVYEKNDIEVMGEICTDSTTTSLDNHGGLSLLFSQESPFCSVVSSMFKCFVFDRSPEYGRHGRIQVRYNLVAPYCSGKDIGISPESDAGMDTGLMRQVFSICGPSIESISFGSMEFDDNTIDGENEKTRIAHKFSALVLEHCANVKELSFHQQKRFKPNWIAEELLFYRFAPQLKSLTLGSYFPTRILDLGGCSSIRELRYMNGCSDHLIQLLLSIGGTLERLRIENFNPNSYCEKLLEVTRRTCTRLHTFDVSDYMQLRSLARESPYAPFLCSYGDQLLRANLSVLDPEALQKVLDSCPRLNLEERWVHSGVVQHPKCVSVLGPRLHSLRLIYSELHANEWSKILAKCTNLHELVVHFDLGLPQLSPLLRLERFEQQEVCVSALFISHLASMSSNLRSVEFLISPDIQTGYIFKPLVESNRFLRDVKIVEHVSEQQPRRGPHTRCSLQLVRELVETFAMCQKLDITLSQQEGERITSRDVGNICGLLPFRGVEVRIAINPHVFYWQTGKPS